MLEPHERQQTVFADCDQLGEKEVRNMLAHGRWNAESERYVRLWLSRKEDERAERSSSEQMRVTRSAKNAAWAAAIAATVASTAAIATAVIAYLALRHHVS